MARTLDSARIRGKAKKREKPLGVAVALGVAATLGIAILIVAIQLLVPHTVVNDFYMLVHYNASATLPLDPLYQRWYETLSEEDAFGTAFSLLCGGLVIGWLAPSYVSRRRVLLAGLGLGVGLPLACLAFLWIGGIVEQNTLNAHEGGQQVGVAAPLSLIVSQTVLVVVWTAVCVFGTWLGFRLRGRSRAKQSAAAAE
jgi:hypothetical protein